MRGLPIPSTETVKRAARRNAPMVRTQLTWIESLLSDGREWIAGGAVTIADFAVYHALWFITARSDRLAHELAPHQNIQAWMQRVRAFGHGDAQRMEPQEALNIAAAADPEAPRLSTPFDEDPPLGSNVRIRADDYARDPVEGELVLITPEEFAVHRTDALVGAVTVHFPRLGYDLRPI